MVWGAAEEMLEEKKLAKYGGRQDFEKVLEWSDDGGKTRYKKTIPYTRANVGIANTAPNVTGFCTYAKLFKCFSNVVSDDEDDGHEE